jgi:glutathione peroxidase
VGINLNPAALLFSNQNYNEMETRQKVLKFFYPAIMGFTRLLKKNADVIFNQEKKDTIVSFYSLKFNSIDGKEVSFNQFKGKKVVLVNVASFCGYTSQYDELEKLYEAKKDKLVILGFPANNFGDQEPGKDEDIASFCRLDYGVTFPIFKKSSVLKPDQNPVYAWLSDPNLNGWNRWHPGWNFCKYVVDEHGRLTHYMGSSVSPLGPEMKNALGLK